MLMDGTTCLKSLLLSINQYKSSRSAANAAQLQKLIHDLCGMKGPRLLSPQQVLPSECLTSDEEIKVALNSTYNLTGTLASVIHSNSATPREGVVLQCLQVLQSLTYSARVSHCFTHMDELLAFLVQHIQAPNDDLTVPCLGLMANLCRYNVSVQTHIKSLSHVKVFYRTLINFLAHSSLTVVVFALSVLTSLTLNEEVGEKLFHARNIHQTFQLIFNIIVNGDGTLTRKYAVDLLVDLVKNPKIANYLTRYEHFSPCLSQVLGLLHNKDPDSAAKVLELLLSLCSVPGLRTLLCQAVFRPAGARLRLGSKKEPQGCGGEPGVALVHWVSMPLDGPDKCYLQALLLLEELFEETIDSALYSSAQPFLDLLLPVLLTMLEAPDSTCSERLLKKHCSRVARALDLLLDILQWPLWLLMALFVFLCVCVIKHIWSLTETLLCTEDSMRMLVAQGLSAAVCLAQMEALFSSGQMDVSFGCTVADSELSQVASEVILKMLDLMRHLKQLVLDMETSFYRILQDQRVVAPLSQSLTSDHREHVQTALRILFEAAPLPDFPVVLLGESITANNAYRQREAELSASRLSGLEPLPAPMLSRSCPPPAPSCQSSGPSQDAIHSLIEKLQSSMELQDHVKDLRVSEIMDVYEQKISALASKEGRLQDLLEAKAMALSQADRLIAQYRCQRAQAEAEARKLASLLKEAEHRKEELQVELSGQVLEAERAQADIQQLLQHNARLQADSQDHQALKASYNELLNRVLSQLAEKEEQIKHLNRNIEEKVQEISGLQEEVRSQEERVRQMDKEKEDMEETIDVLRKELNKTEQARKEASIRASSLELQKSQLEAKLQKKEEELSKHSQMIAMIHSLSSGKLKSDSLSL
ncbi:protein CIP2A-like [Scleropages formosus]|uniref:Protein CIP2A-like n=1 Tax=Scleropages formosus TaxID=113540 RepID=A0A0P7ULV0_SCLFO|nr:protein CIP2A-like [Scleropages formosus]